MDSIEVLERELEYLDMSLDDYYDESEETNETRIDKIKAAFNKLSTHLDDAMLYTQSYIDMQNKQKDNSDYRERLISLINQANRAIANNMDSMAVYDNRPVYNKFNQSTSYIFNNLEKFIAKRDFKTIDDVMKERDTLLDIIKNFDDSLDKDVDVKVWLNPATVKSVCENALSQGMAFNMNLKNVYMDITRLNNKISNIVRDESLSKDIKSELVSSSIRLTRKTASYCISWNKHIMTHYPMTKA